MATRSPGHREFTKGGWWSFPDDTTSDVRDGFRDLIGEALSTEQAFWLGLAVTQWKCGRLLERVKEKALEIIDTGADLKRWSGDIRRFCPSRNTFQNQ